MAQPQLSIRSARARDLAYEISRKERRSIAQVVELALEQYAGKNAETHESAADFYARLAALEGEEVDFDAILAENRKPNHGIEL